MTPWFTVRQDLAEPRETPSARFDADEQGLCSPFWPTSRPCEKKDPIFFQVPPQFAVRQDTSRNLARPLLRGSMLMNKAFASHFGQPRSLARKRTRKFSQTLPT